MDGEILVGIVVVAAPAVAFAYQQLFWHASFQAHKLEKMDASATEIRDTETVPAKN